MSARAGSAARRAASLPNSPGRSNRRPCRLRRSARIHARLARQQRLLGLLIEGRTNAEIAAGAWRRRRRSSPSSSPRCTRHRRVVARRGDRSWRCPGRCDRMAIHVRVDRPLCIGAGNCIALAPTAFDWLTGDFAKAMVVDPDSVDEEVLRAAAIVVPDARHHHRGGRRAAADPAARPDGGSRRVEKTFLFTDIVGSTQPRRAARRRGVGDAARLARRDAARPVRDSTTARRSSPPATASSSASTRRRRHRLRDRDPADARAHRREHGFAPKVRIGIHFADGPAGRPATTAARASTRPPASPASRTAARSWSAGDGEGHALQAVGPADRRVERALGAGGGRFGRLALRFDCHWGQAAVTAPVAAAVEGDGSGRRRPRHGGGHSRARS